MMDSKNCHSIKTLQHLEVVNISQAQIIDDIVSQAEKGMNGELPRDIFITASTGAGKSLMFQIPALYLAEQYKDKIRLQSLFHHSSV